MEFEIKGVNYRASKLSVFDQLKVSRKLLPVLAGMLGDFQGIKAAAQGGDVNKAIESALPKIADSLAEMSEEDTNAIIFPCLSVVARQNGKVWAPVMSQNELMFDDIDLMSMLQIVGRVVGDSLGNFLPAAPDKEIADNSAA
ncbi:phage tail assembly chaperone [Pantoea agglomerans]|uniref:phage tail assembly chaperone n=1 Tax=Enterobacter agglomerans TaxID=549 RepID=UPI00320862F1